MGNNLCLDTYIFQNGLECIIKSPNTSETIMINNLSANEISSVNGGSVCLKTSLATAASVCNSVGLILQGFGQALHATVPNLSDPTLKWGPQAKAGLAIGIIGVVLNCAGVALSSYSAAESTCP